MTTLARFEILHQQSYEHTLQTYVLEQQKMAKKQKGILNFDFQNGILSKIVENIPESYCQMSHLYLLLSTTMMNWPHLQIYREAN